LNPWIESLVAEWKYQKHNVKWVNQPADIPDGELCFMLSCSKLVTSDILKRNKHNLVVHESDLPQGKGWSPMTWQVLEGKQEIPVTLFEAVEAVDSGPIYLQGSMLLEGHELVDELRAKQADATLKLMETNIEYRHLKREVELNASIVEHLQLSFQDALVKDSRGYDLVRILEYATYPKESVGTSRFFAVIVSLFLGLVVGIVISSILESFDTSIRVVEDIENFLELPVLSVIPHITQKSQNNLKRFSKLSSDKKTDGKTKLGLITHFSPKSPIAEAYRTLRTNLDLQRSETSGETILITSSAMREGKSTTITNLAITIAQMGNRVLLIGCNLRRPSIYRTFNIDKKPGVTDIILGTVAWEDTVKNVTDMFVSQAVEISDVLFSPGLDNLNIITSGATPPNPSELLSSLKFRQFLEEVRKVYDIVLIDSPPTLPVTDAAIIAPLCDQVLLVYQIGRISRDALGRAKSHLDTVEAKITGVVLNDIKAELNHYSYDSAYTAPYYGEDTKKKDERKIASRS